MDQTTFDYLRKFKCQIVTDQIIYGFKRTFNLLQTIK